MSMLKRNFVGGIGDGKRRRRGPWSSTYVSLHVAPSNSPNFMYLCSVSYVLGVIRTLQGWNGSEGTELPILHKQSLQWRFRCMRLRACVGSVCVGGTALMCRGRDVQGWVRQLDESPSTRHWTVEVYVPQGPHRGAAVVFGYQK